MDPWILICERTVPYSSELSHRWASWSRFLFLILNICDVRIGVFHTAVHQLGQNSCFHCTAGYSEVPGVWGHPATPLQPAGHFWGVTDLVLLPCGVVNWHATDSLKLMHLCRQLCGTRAVSLTSPRNIELIVHRDIRPSRKLNKYTFVPFHVGSPSADVWSREACTSFKHDDVLGP